MGMARQARFDREVVSAQFLPLVQHWSYLCTVESPHSMSHYQNRWQCHYQPSCIHRHIRTESGRRNWRSLPSPYHKLGQVASRIQLLWNINNIVQVVVRGHQFHLHTDFCSFKTCPHSKTTLGQRWPNVSCQRMLTLGQRQPPTLAQRHFAPKDDVGPTLYGGCMDVANDVAPTNFPPDANVVWASFPRRQTAIGIINWF